MQYNQALANRVRETLADWPDVEETGMFGCLAFMVNGKLCICVEKEELLLRTDPKKAEDLLAQHNCRPMMQNNRIMKGWIRVEERALQSQKGFDYWTGLALHYNQYAKAAKKKVATKQV